MARHIRTDAWQPQPWKNGGGITHEIWKDGDGPDGFAVRLSSAKIAVDGPFSLFPGVDRTIVLLDGAGFALHADDGRRVTLGEVAVPFAFRGEEAWTCHLVHGAVGDLNLMVARDHAAADLRVVPLGPRERGAPCTTVAARLVLVFALDPGVRVTRGAQGHALGRWDTLVSGGVLGVWAEVPARAVVITVEDAHQRAVRPTYDAAVVELVDGAPPPDEPMWIVTACNPGGARRAEADNDDASIAMARLITRRRIRSRPAVGRNPEGTWREPSFALMGCGRDVALELAARFGQDAIFEWRPGAAPTVVWCARDAT